MKKIAFVGLVSSMFSCSVGAATTTELKGGYIASAYADGCDPTTEPQEIVDSQRRYEPRHCTIVRSRNPVFVVSVPTNTDFAADMKLVLIPPEGPTKTLTFKGPRLLLPPEHALQDTETGIYKWHVKYKHTGSDEWHQTGERTFLYEPELDVIADGAQIRKKIFGTPITPGQPQRRLLPRKDGSVMAGPDFHARLSTSDLKDDYEKTLKSADLWLNSNEKTYVDARAVTEPLTKEEATDASSHQMKAITRLAMASYAYGKDATGKDAYSDDAIRRLMLLAKWGYKEGKYNSEATSGEKHNDQANRNIYYTLAFGLDMLPLTVEQQQAVLISLKGRLNAVQVTKLDTGPYDAHMLTAALMSTEAILMASGIEAKAKDGSVVKFEDENPGKLLEDSWNRVVTTLGTWGGGSDSAYGNGVNYAWLSLVSYSQAFANYMLMTGENLTTLPAMDNFHNNFLAFTPRYTKALLMSPFGDGTEDRELYKNYGYSAYRLFALVSGKPIDEWYHQNSSTDAADQLLPVQHFFLRAIKIPPKLEEEPVPPNSYLFEDAGLVAMHSKLNDSQRSSLYFRSSRFGSHNHNHADSNAFTFVSKGRDIFVSGGWYVKYDDELHKSFTRATRFKNAVTYCYNVSAEPYTCAGMGQSEPSAVATSSGQPEFSALDAPGKLVNYSADKDRKWSVVTGDATKAYSGRSGGIWQPMLLNAVRTIAYNRSEGIVIIYDWAESSDQRYWQQNYQTLYAPVPVKDFKDRGLSIQPLKRDAKGEILLEGGQPVSDGSPVCLAYHGKDGKFHTQAMSDLVAHIPLPKDKPLARSPAQFHTTYTHNAKSNQMVSITVIAENCARLGQDVKPVTDTKWTVRFSSSFLTFEKDTVTIVE